MALSFFFFSLLPVYTNCIYYIVTSVMTPTVDVSLKGRTVSVKGPRGVLRRQFNHINLELRLLGKKQKKVMSIFVIWSSYACATIYHKNKLLI